VLGDLVRATEGLLVRSLVSLPVELAT
jgi:hypothetical protein